jgi:tripartite-type tricarboxylate transporter receptor subunit TctC
MKPVSSRKRWARRSASKSSSRTSAAPAAPSGQRAAKATPDGYTLLLHHIGMATAPALYRKLPSRSIDDFEPIGPVTDVPMTLVAKRDFRSGTCERSSRP